MNRAERRGNTRVARRQAAVSMMTKVKEAQVHQPPGEGRNTERGSIGRFKAVVALSPALTRQQRRYQERMALKVASAWKGVTKGDGVTLLDGEEVGDASRRSSPEKGH